jgi:hypothetical protein
MKKQNVNNKLAFNKAAVIELNDQKLVEVNGGTSFNCSIALVTLITRTIGAQQ